MGQEAAGRNLSQGCLGGGAQLREDGRGRAAGLGRQQGAERGLSVGGKDVGAGTLGSGIKAPFLDGPVSWALERAQIQALPLPSYVCDFRKTT